MECLRTQSQELTGLSAVCRLNDPQRHRYLKGFPAPKCHCRGAFLNHYVYIWNIMLPPAQKDAAWLPALAREESRQ